MKPRVYAARWRGAWWWFVDVGSGMALGRRSWSSAMGEACQVARSNAEVAARAVERPALLLSDELVASALQARLTFPRGCTPLGRMPEAWVEDEHSAP